MIERYVATGVFSKRTTTPLTEKPNIEDVPKKRAPTGTDVVHLHWLWKRGPAALRGITSAVALCGSTSIPRECVTSFLDDATCPMCKRLGS